MEKIKCNNYCKDLNIRDGKDYCDRYNCNIINKERCKDCVVQFNRRKEMYSRRND